MNLTPIPPYEPAPTTDPAPDRPGLGDYLDRLDTEAQPGETDR